MANPVRTCIGCRGRAAKGELSRLVWDEASSRVLSDPRQRLPGRGVYLHPGCADRVLRQRGVGRGLRRAVDADQVRALLAELTASPVWVNPPREH